MQEEPPYPSILVVEKNVYLPNDLKLSSTEQTILYILMTVKVFL